MSATKCKKPGHEVCLNHIADAFDTLTKMQGWESRRPEFGMLGHFATEVVAAKANEALQILAEMVIPKEDRSQVALRLRDLSSNGQRLGLAIQMGDFIEKLEQCE